MAHVQNESDIRNYIFRRLGETVINVEMTTEQLDDGIQDAKWWFASHIGLEKWVNMDVSSGQSVYDAPATAESVVRIDFQPASTDIDSTYDWFNIGHFQQYQQGVRGINLGATGDLMHYRVYRESAMRSLSADLDWEYDRWTNKFSIHPIPDQTYKIRVTYLESEIDLAELRQYEYDLVRRYSLAVAMSTLGNIRSKYSEVPSAAGSVSLNGDALKTESEALMMALEEKVKSLKRPLGFIAG